MWFSKSKMKQNKKNKQTACPTTDNSESHVQIYSWNLPISLSPSCPSLQAEVHSGVWAQHQKVVMCAWFHYLFFKEWECNVGFRVPASFLLPYARHPLLSSTSQGCFPLLGTVHPSLPRLYQGARLISLIFPGNFIILSNSSSPSTLSKVRNN